MKIPGWASLMTLLSDTAYPSFIGEVEALNTTTIRRLIQSARHQLPAIAPSHLTLDTPDLPSRSGRSMEQCSCRSVIACSAWCSCCSTEVNLRVSEPARQT